ncbi:unnamed protein product [Sphagnum balticum]
MGALCSCLGGDSPKESKEPNNQAPGAVVNTSEPSSRAGLAAIRRAELFANTPAGKAAHKVAKAKTSLAPNRGGEPVLKVLANGMMMMNWSKASCLQGIVHMGEHLAKGVFDLDSGNAAELQAMLSKVFSNFQCANGEVELQQSYSKVIVYLSDA